MVTKGKIDRGSTWQKWDLQVHAPGGNLYDGYKTQNGSDPLDQFCDLIENSDVIVFGITDYFSVESFKSFIKRFNEKYPNSSKVFFFNLELRLNETVNKQHEEINTHLVFNPESLDRIEKFLSQLHVVKTGKDGTPIACSELNSKEDFESATVTRNSIDSAYEKTFGKSPRQEHFLVITAANNDGLRAESGKKRKEHISDEIDKFSDAFFGGIQNIEYYQKTDRLEDKGLTISPKPVVSCSDAHTFDEIKEYVGKRVIEDDKGTSKIHKDVTWIKADPTFEGLKQIIYEPSPGERVVISPIKPDQKDDFSVISKIKFVDDDFPEEILLNENLCSIIGSRSSGKSALLSYIAHAVDPELAEQIMSGPGDGEEFHWDKIKTGHSIEWQNGKSNEDSPGKIVYIPQNYLFEKSKDPNEVRRKIEPVLFRTLPEFRIKFEQTESDIIENNQGIASNIEKWFQLAASHDSLSEKLKNLGDAKAIETEKLNINTELDRLKKEYSLSDEDLKKYQEITEKISALNGRINQINLEQNKFLNVTQEKGFFNGANITLSPTIENLPITIRDSIKSFLKETESEILKKINLEVLTYKNKISKEKESNQVEIDKILKENKDLIQKQEKNLEIQNLVQKATKFGEVIKKIKTFESQILSTKTQLDLCIKAISINLKQRDNLLKNILENIKNEKQDSDLGIQFGLEYKLDESLEAISRRINMKINTDYVWDSELHIEKIRENPGKFLEDIHTEKQKIIIKNIKEDVARDALTLTEKILFIAEMEGDRIGGFTEPTMTPGKRALFALRLILIESEDTWPLLIDQPEDDLDSRSIYDEVVPFLKSRKKERQIIMVTHDANLVIGADSEQVIVSNRNADNRKNEDGKQFNYCTGSLEHTQDMDNSCLDTLRSQGICEHACQILDGGKIAFESRKNKYNIK